VINLEGRVVNKNLYPGHHLHASKYARLAHFRASLPIQRLPAQTQEVTSQCDMDSELITGEYPRYKNHRIGRQGVF